MSAYAIIKTGGKQYRVGVGDVIDVELLQAEKNQEVEFKQVLFFHDGKECKVEAKQLAGCSVSGEVMDSVRGPKVVAYKYKKRKNYRRKVGHRQHYMRVKIKEFKEG